jgi:hypothetical protein
MAMHHLPDVWKQVALRRMADMLAPGGRLHLRDAVFQFQPSGHAEAFGNFVRGACEHFGPEMTARAERHIREEFSTMDWILEGMLRRAGFRIEMADHFHGPASYFCRKE